MTQPEPKTGVCRHVFRQLLVLAILPIAVPLFLMLFVTMWTLVLLGMVYMDSAGQWAHHFAITERFYRRIGLNK